MSDLVPVMPHGALREVFPDLFFVTGTSRPTFMSMSWQFSRNMTVVRDGDALTLVNTVRLDEPALAELDRLGQVKHVVKLGDFHGMDDRFYVERYGATQWGLAGMVHDGDRRADRELAVSGELPIEGASLFVFETSQRPEGLLLLEREGGVLISCDSLQNWAEVDAFFSEESAAKMKSLGFIRPANIGPGWRMACKPEAKDFARLGALPFQHLLPAHGTPILGDARAQLSATFSRELGVPEAGAVRA